MKKIYLSLMFVIALTTMLASCGNHHSKSVETDKESVQNAAKEANELTQIDTLALTTKKDTPAETKQITTTTKPSPKTTKATKKPSPKTTTKATKKEPIKDITSTKPKKAKQKPKKKTTTPKPSPKNTKPKKEQTQNIATTKTEIAKNTTSEIKKPKTNAPQAPTTFSTPTNPTTTPKLKDDVKKDYQTGQIYLKIKPSAKIALAEFDLQKGDTKLSKHPLQSFIEQYGIVKIQKPFKRLKTMSNTYRLEFNNAAQTAKLIQTLQQLDYVEYAEKVPVNKTY